MSLTDTNQYSSAHIGVELDSETSRVPSYVWVLALPIRKCRSLKTHSIGDSAQTGEDRGLGADLGKEASLGEVRDILGHGELSYRSYS